MWGHQVVVPRTGLVLAGEYSSFRSFSSFSLKNLNKNNKNLKKIVKTLRDVSLFFLGKTTKKTPIKTTQKLRKTMKN